MVKLCDYERERERNGCRDEKEHRERRKEQKKREKW